MAGYYRFSMSNNAISAYNSGEKPFSKWRKSDILEELGELANRFEKVPAPALKSALLYKSSWHHTSKHFNKTNFYSVDLDKAEEMTDAEIAALCASKVAKHPPKTEKRHVSYLVWSGTRKHPKAERHEAECEIVGNWAFTPHGKKSISANGFEFLD